MRRAAIIVTLAFGGLAAVYGALVLLDLLARRDVRTSQALVLPASGRLELDIGSGDVEVLASEGAPRLEARTTRGLFGSSEVRMERGPDGRVSLRAECGGLQRGLGCGGSLRVLVPRGTAVDVGSGSGELGVRGIRGGVVAETGSGDISLEDVRGPAVSVDTGSGEITASGVAAARVRAETGSGDVRISATRPPDDVYVDTGSGEIQLGVPDEIYNVFSDTGSGEENVTVRSAAGASRRLRVQTGSGDIIVRPFRSSR